MEFSIVSHACVDIQHTSKRLVVDPWLFDSVYWGSWWHYPEPEFDDSLFQADFIYLTHWHFDHFHPTTLAKFRKDCHVLVPRFPVSTLVEQLGQVGLKKVTELEHAKPFELAPGFTITSFQVQCQDDSVLAVHAGDTVLIDLNDAHPLPSTWRLIKRRFPKVDFALRSHSAAWSFPTCFTFDCIEDALPVDREIYKIAFWQAMEKLRPRYAIPFASGICHLHRETLKENEFLVPGYEMTVYMDQHPIPGVETVLMPHNASWSSEHGFRNLQRRVPDITEYVVSVTLAKKTELEKIYAAEDGRSLTFAAFEKFFGRFLAATRLLRPLFRISWDFEIRQNGTEECWRVDLGRSKISKVPMGSAGSTSTIIMHPGVLADAIETFTFTNIDIAKRWQVCIHPGGLTKHLLMMTLVALFEAGYLSSQNFLRVRTLAVLMRRFPEAIDYSLLSLKLLTRGAQSAVDLVAKRSPAATG